MPTFGYTPGGNAYPLNSSAYDQSEFWHQVALGRDVIDQQTKDEAITAAEQKVGEEIAGQGVSRVRGQIPAEITALSQMNHADYNGSWQANAASNITDAPFSISQSTLVEVAIGSPANASRQIISDVQQSWWREALVGSSTTAQSWGPWRKSADLDDITAALAGVSRSRGPIFEPTNIDGFRTADHSGTWAGRVENMIGAPSELGPNDAVTLTVDHANANGVAQVMRGAAGIWRRIAASDTTWDAWTKDVTRSELESIETDVAARQLIRHLPLTSPVDIDQLRNGEHAGPRAGRIQNMVGGPSQIPYNTPCNLDVQYSNSNGVVQTIDTPSEVWRRTATTTTGFGPWRKMAEDSGTLTTITGWGDSMTTDYGSLDTSSIAEIAGQLGLSHVDHGRSGTTPTEIAWRMGALRFGITVDGGVIPASDQVPCTISHPGGDEGFFNAYAWAAEITTASGDTVRVTLRSASTSMGTATTWTIAQASGATSPVEVLPDTRIRLARTDHAERSPAIIWMGRNDSRLESSVGRYETALRAMLSEHRDPQRRVIVLPVWNRTTEHQGSADYNRVMEINAKAKEIAGARFYDLRAAVISHGLEVAGITPTADDLTAIGNDTPPPSLMMDITHPNVAGRQVIGKLVADEIRGRSWS